MQLVTFQYQGRVRLGAQIIRDGGAYILDLNHAQPDLPADLLLLLESRGFRVGAGT